MNLPEAFLALKQSLPSYNEALARRLDRAYDIVRMPGYEITLVVDTTPDGKPAVESWRVEKASTAALDSEPQVYSITEAGCSCPDSLQAPAGLCKHRLAVQLIQLMSEV